jgi:hypothetical protein
MTWVKVFGLCLGVVILCGKVAVKTYPSDTRGRTPSTRSSIPTGSHAPAYGSRAAKRAEAEKRGEAERRAQARARANARAATADCCDDD